MSPKEKHMLALIDNFKKSKGNNYVVRWKVPEHNMELTMYGRLSNDSNYLYGLIQFN